MSFTKGNVPYHFLYILPFYWRTHWILYLVWFHFTRKQRANGMDGQFSTATFALLSLFLLWWDIHLLLVLATDSLLQTSIFSLALAFWIQFWDSVVTLMMASLHYFPGHQSLNQWPKTVQLLQLIHKLRPHRCQLIRLKLQRIQQQWAQIQRLQSRQRKPRLQFRQLNQHWLQLIQVQPRLQFNRLNQQWLKSQELQYRHFQLWIQLRRLKLWQLQFHQFKQRRFLPRLQTRRLQLKSGRVYFTNRDYFARVVSLFFHS